MPNKACELTFYGSPKYDYQNCVSIFDGATYEPNRPEIMCVQDGSVSHIRAYFFNKSASSTAAHKHVCFSMSNGRLNKEEGFTAVTMNSEPDAIPIIQNSATLPDLEAGFEPLKLFVKQILECSQLTTEAVEQFEMPQSLPKPKKP